MSAIGSFFHFLTVEIYQRKKSSGAQNSLRLKREVKTMSKKSKPELENMKFEVAREYGINMTKIESRPVKDRPGDYRFFIEADCDIAEDRVREMLETIKANTLECKLLGAYSSN